MATTEGRIRAPRSLGTTFAILLRTYATHVLVVPRSMPSRMGFSAMGALRRRMLRLPRRGWQETAGNDVFSCTTSGIGRRHPWGCPPAPRTGDRIAACSRDVEEDSRIVYRVLAHHDAE